MGFATFDKKAGVDTMDVIAASLRWQREFLQNLDGIGFHCLLGNMKGGFADILFAGDQSSFERMGEAYAFAPSSVALMALLDTESIQLRSAQILKENFTVPLGFSCIEAGFMNLIPGRSTLDVDVVKGSNVIENEYLEGDANTMGHLLGKTADGSYCEITFGQTLGQTREICLGYETSDVCMNFLRLFEEKSSEFDFWVPLA